MASIPSTLTFINLKKGAENITCPNLADIILFLQDSPNVFTNASTFLQSLLNVKDNAYF